MPSAIALPRIVIAGLAGESGKTLVSLGLVLAARQRGLTVRAFKKGPDYIDAAWLGWATRHNARNLDTYLMGFSGAAGSFARHAVSDGINVIEGNRGLYDGSDARGTHSTAELAKTLGAPVVLVLNATKVTRTAAACVLGCQKLDPDVVIAGVVLNQVGTARHGRVASEAIEAACGVPVVGVLPRLEDTILPGRHLGLVTPEEHSNTGHLEEHLLEFAMHHLEIGRLLSIASQAAPMERDETAAGCPSEGAGLRVAYLKDSAFTFYYPENLEAIEKAGAELVPVSALTADALPPGIHALYIGGGFPETHGAQLSSNTPFLRALARAAAEGLPVYAECGGLMLLSRAIHWNGGRYPMSGVLPFEVQVCPAPQGHGYVRLRVDRPNPFFAPGTVLTGHEFHYSRIAGGAEVPSTACSVERGTGCGGQRDGIVAGNVWASYTHLHALATPEWAGAFLGAARLFAHHEVTCATTGGRMEDFQM